MIKIFSLLIAITLFYQAQAQRQGSITGTVTDKNLLTPVGSVSVQVVGTSLGTTTDSSGKFRISGILPKSYTLQFTSVGYNEVTLFNIVITSGNEINLTVQLEPSITRLEDVVIKSSRRTAVAASLETPLSVQRLTTEEIRSNPGGNFDISRVIQALPGVGGTAGSVGGF